MTERVKVVFASMLKPVDEPRMYEKLGRSLAQTYKYDVNIIGFSSKNLRSDPLITFWPLFNFPRISLKRFLAPLLYFKKILQLKPEIIVVNSPDFLLLTALYKILFGALVLYDVQENYYRNIIWSHSRPSLWRKARATWTRAKEYLFDRIVIHYLIAEHCYSIECSFITKPVLLLENKARKPLKLSLPKPSNPQEPLRLLYSGTIAESYGIFDTLPLVEALALRHPQIEYVVCGHCPSEEVALKLTLTARSCPWLKLKISPTPIPHEEILQELAKAHFSLIAYRLNPSNENCMPTRIWEALAWRTPMILRKEHPWVSLAAVHEAGFSIDFLNPDPDLLYSQVFHKKYYQQTLPESIYWESIEDKWLTTVDAVAEKLRLQKLSK